MTVGSVEPLDGILPSFTCTNLLERGRSRYHSWRSGLCPVVESARRPWNPQRLFGTAGRQGSRHSREFVIARYPSQIVSEREHVDALSTALPDLLRPCAEAALRWGWRNPMGFVPEIRFAPDSPLEGTGFEPPVPLAETNRSFRRNGKCRRGEKSRLESGGPKVRILFPPAESPLRTGALRLVEHQDVRLDPALVDLALVRSRDLDDDIPF
jgi:hypothetical protein